MKKMKSIDKKKALIISACVAAAVILCVLLAVFLPKKAFAPNEAETTGLTDSSGIGAAEQSLSEPSGTQESGSGESTELSGGLTEPESQPKGDFITLTDKTLAEFESYLAKDVVKYDCENFYDVKYALKYVEERDRDTVSHSYDIRVNGKVEFDSFYNLVKKNNAEFLSSADGRDHHDYTDKELRKYCQIITDCANEMQEKLPKTAVDSLCCVMYDIKVLDYKYDDEGILAGVDPNAYNNFYINNTLTDYENEDSVSASVKSTFYHEMIHLIQSSCNCCSIQDGYRGGTSIAFNDSYLNPTYWGWLIESTAEQNAAELASYTPDCAFEWIEYSRWLNLILAMNGDKADYRMQDIDLQKNMEKLFSAFDLKTSKEREEFIKMMYSAEIIMNTPEEFKYLCADRYGLSGEKLERKLDDIRYNLRTPVLRTMSKLFYRSLAREINAGNVTMGDAFYMIRVFESEIVNFNADEIKPYVAIRNEFFKALSKDNGVEAAKISDDFTKQEFLIDYERKAVNRSAAPLKFLTSNQRRKADSLYINIVYM